MKPTRNTVKRAIRTFIQTVIGYIAVNMVMINFTEEKSIVKQAVIALCVSSVSAGLSAVMNLEKGCDNSDL